MLGNLVWIDLEMTGLNPEHHVIVEIASIVTDEHLKRPGRGTRYCDPSAQYRAFRHGIVEPSNIIRLQVCWIASRASVYSTEQAEEETLSFIKQLCRKGPFTPLRQFPSARTGGFW